MEKTRANFTTQGAAIKNLEVKVGKFVEKLTNIPINTFLINNTRKEYKTIILRNVNMDEKITQNDDKIGEALEDKKQEEYSAISPQAPQVKVYVTRRPKVERKSPREAKKNKESKENGQKAKKPKSALTARPHPLHGAPTPSFLDEEVFRWWRGRTTQMAHPHHPIS
ncbi:hypothetical protein PIB30_067341 [Stylosanthes scabra]|uniref:Uncharacterized protein n=1 Tax=Stylosanthes scabra TaxID=79078 RepID=A0ABU6XMW1_9FABA|nr:hypothetical protein [Stylosanthes scabra]